MDQLSHPEPGASELFRILLRGGVHVGTVGRPFNVDSRGGLGGGVGDAHGVPGINGAVNKDHVSQLHLLAPVLSVGGLRYQISDTTANTSPSHLTFIPSSSKSRLNLGPYTSVHIFSKNSTGMRFAQAD